MRIFVRFSLAFCLVLVAAGTPGCGDAAAPPSDGGSGIDGAQGDAPESGGCTTSGECTTIGAPHCDLPRGACVECVEPAHCSDVEAPLCLANECRGCITDTQCMDQVGMPICRSDGNCVGCETATDCSTLTPFCTSDGVCAECLAATDCSDLAPACSGGACRSCTDVACTPEQELRELFALVCASAILGEGNSDLADGFEALFCSSRQDLFVLFGYIESAVGAGRIEIDEGRFAECSAAGAFDLLGGGGCAAAFRGTVADGAVCAIGFECTSSRCDVPAGSCAGVCVRLADPGGPCDDDDACAAGLICLSSVCQAPPGEGAICTGRCGDGLFCNASNVCEVQHDVGGACRGVTAGGDCRDGLACQSSRCSVPPGAGAACWPAYLPRCADGLRCAADVCRSPSATGTSCTTTTECAFGARCAAAACVAIIGIGGACSAGDPCALGTGCTDGRCRPLPDLGEPCFDAGCLRGVCRAGTCQAQALFTPCPPGVYLFDVLDPCGGMSSCSETPSGWLCAAEGGLGAACGAVEDPACRQPDLYCNSARACTAYCTP